MLLYMFNYSTCVCMFPITADSADSDSEEIAHEKPGSGESGSHGDKVDDSHDNIGLSESEGKDEDNVASQSRNKTKEKTRKITEVYTVTTSLNIIGGDHKLFSALLNQNKCCG